MSRVYLHGVEDPGNVGTIMRSAHALADGPVVLGPGCADPFSPKAVRASMGSMFARPPARAERLDELPGTRVALDAEASTTCATSTLDAAARARASAPSGRGLPDGAGAPARCGFRCATDSLNVAMAATVALYEVAHRMAAHA